MPGSGGPARARSGWRGWAARDAQARTDADGVELLVQELELDAGDSHDFVLVLSLDGRDGDVPDPEAAWGGTEAAWRELVPDLAGTVAQRDARHAYAVLSGLTSRGRRDGRSGDDGASRARERGPQLRLPLRLDSRPGLRGPGGRRGRAAPADGQRGRFRRAIACSPTARDLRPAYTTPAGEVPDERRLGLPGLPGRQRTSSETGSTTSSSSTPSARPCCSSPPPPATTTSTPTAGGPPRSPPPRSRSAGTSRTPGSGSSIRPNGRTAA